MPYLIIARRLLVQHRIQIAVVLFGLLVFGLRRPDDIIHPQLIAEDGREWLQRAIDSDYSPLTLVVTYAGYLALLPRIVALFSGLFPLEATPLIFNTCAIFIQVLPLIYIWSKRVDFISVRGKIFATVFYLLVPFTSEINVNVTNSQWYLALILYVLAFIKESKNLLTRWVERVFAFVISLSGPFAIILAPILLFESYRSKKVHPIHAIIVFGAFIQAISVLITLETRAHVNIGVSISQLLQIIGGQIFGAGLFGDNALGFFLQKPWITPIATVLGLQLLAYVFIKSNNFVRYFIVFAGLIFCSALVSPNGIPAGYTWWQTLTVEGVGGRYYFIPHIAIFISLGWLLFTKKKVSIILRATAALILIPSLLIGTKNDFIHQPRKDLHYQSYIREYRHLEMGKSVYIPINPGPSPPWQVKITKER